MDTVSSLLQTFQVLVALSVLSATLWLLRQQRSRAGSTAELSESRRLWAIAEWKRLGGEVFAEYVHQVEEPVWALWGRLRLSEEQGALNRVCTWCGKTGVPGHVFGVVNAKGGFNAWYCSNACYRAGNSYEDLP